ncbi:uncharacterized protein K452DRAFT_361478 [Aplosporella prunicola CBS 121167]|uniref:Zn(2)-C6 fungal-type domain-containing protein n=1 Tax=Aplosporella prunicola CBS 121167 TaxID=1176127 RepID=A0A6A6B3P9_9PEZI|nr:uncharacterized protein K452DRAFT_361478 [Aplosporella prunicola CBS 121167]KAF2137993.1 hypothetical protein K452DRAFT_361478 [Aplosporella prunicola CBS 121167]
MEQTPTNSSRRSHSPEDANSEVRKRRRIALSCYDCRRRKLRCDREYPACGRCRKGGHADTCTYDTRVEPIPAREPHQVPRPGADDSRAQMLSPTSPNDLNSSTRTPILDHSSRNTVELLSFQRAKIAELEARLARIESNGTQSSSSPHHPTRGSPAPQDEILWPSQAFAWSRRPVMKDVEESETILLRGKGFKTQFFGATNVIANMVTHFPGLRSYMQGALRKYPSLVQGHTESKAIQSRWKRYKQVLASMPAPELSTFLPERSVVDHLVKLYFDTLETIYRILHRPSFWEEYSTFWSEPEKRRPEFVAIVLAVISTVITASFTEPTTYCAEIPIQLWSGTQWVEACDRWVSQQSAKHAQIDIYQVRCLCVLSRYINSIKWKQQWMDSRNLMTFAMTTGLHRDPRWLLKETSTHDQEMRRRLFYTMVELDLQGSINRGMPSATHAQYYDTAAPLNVNDDDIDHEGRKAPPTSWPIQEYTSTSYLHASAKSIDLRIRINSALNNSARPLSYDEAMLYSNDVVQELGKIPSWAGRKEARLARTTLDIQLRQYLIMLHEPFAWKAASDVRYSYSRAACFDAGASIVDQYNELSSMDRVIMNLLRSDPTRAALAIIQTTFVSTLAQDFRFFQSHKAVIDDLVQKALDMVEDKTLRTSAGCGHMWHISAACNLLLSKVAPEEAESRLKEAVERVIGIFDRISQSQEPVPALPNTNTTDTPVIPGTSASYTNESSLPDELAFANDISGTDTAMFNFPETQAWGLDDLWSFGPIDL